MNDWLIVLEKVILIGFGFILGYAFSFLLDLCDHFIKKKRSK